MERLWFLTPKTAFEELWGWCSYYDARRKWAKWTYAVHISWRGNSLLESLFAQTLMGSLAQDLIPSKFFPTGIPRFLCAVDQDCSWLAKRFPALMLQTRADMLVDHGPIPLL